MSFSSLNGSGTTLNVSSLKFPNGTTQTTAGSGGSLIGYVAAEGQYIPMITDGSTQQVIAQTITVASQYNLFTGTLLIQNQTQDPTPENQTLTIYLKNESGFILVAQNIVIPETGFTEVQISSIDNAKGPTTSLSLFYQATIPSGSTSTYKFQALASYSPITLNYA